MSQFKQFGVMIDCSRNAVIRVEQLKKFIDIISKFGYNQLMLYTEDVYEIDDEPFFGYMRGRYTQQELKLVDEYAAQRGVELVPCIQTLAHLSNLFRHSPYAELHDIDDCLLLEEEKTYNLIEKMIATCAKCFTSKKIHLGMDESMRLGFGRYYLKHGYKTKAELLLGHTKKVYHIAKKYNFTELKVWYDQFAWSAFGDDFYFRPRKRNDDFADQLPKDLKIVYWDYGEWEFPEETYNYHIQKYREINGNLSFAGFAYKWSGILPDNVRSIQQAKLSINACKENGIDDYLVTSWGDDGSESSIFTILPALYATAKMSREEEIDKKEFKQIVGVEFDDFLLLDKMNNPGEAEHALRQITPVLLYNDVFQNVADGLVYDGLNQFYKNLAGELALVQGKDFQYLFDSALCLCEVLALKSELGKKIRKYYIEKNKNELANAIKEVQLTLDKIDSYEKTYRKQWHLENKAFGYFYISMKIGALKERLRYCMESIEAYLNDGLGSIEELEESVIYALHDINRDIAGFRQLLGHGYC